MPERAGDPLGSPVRAGRLRVRPTLMERRAEVERGVRELLVQPVALDQGERARVAPPRRRELAAAVGVDGEVALHPHPVARSTVGLERAGGLLEVRARGLAPEVALGHAHVLGQRPREPRILDLGSFELVAGARGQRASGVVVAELDPRAGLRVRHASPPLRVRRVRERVVERGQRLGRALQLQEAAPQLEAGLEGRRVSEPLEQLDRLGQRALLRQEQRPLDRRAGDHQRARRASPTCALTRRRRAQQGLGPLEVAGPRAMSDGDRPRGEDRGQRGVRGAARLGG
ncbi:MAG TPA: hypothetical protein DEF51_21760, partial [Myxococcales bacterium]|nr:hypothetical protein [Myxococcales bacterium]